MLAQPSRGPRGPEVPEAVMVTVGLSIGHDEHGPVAISREGSGHQVGETPAVGEGLGEGDVVGELTVTEHDAQARPRGQAHEVGPRGVEAGGVDLAPLAVERAHASGLRGHQHRELDALGGEDLE